MREEMVGQDWRMWRRSSLARSVMCIAKRRVVKRASFAFGFFDLYCCLLFVLSMPS